MSLYNIGQVLVLCPPQVGVELSSYSWNKSRKFSLFHPSNFLKLYSLELLFSKVGKLQ